MEGGFCRLIVQSSRLERGAYRDHVAGLADDFEGLTEIVDLLSTRVQDRVQDRVFGQPTSLGHDNHATPRE